MSAKGNQGLQLIGPGEVIAREQKAIAHQQNRMPLGMTGHWHNQNIWSKLDGVLSLKDLFYSSGVCGEIILMEKAIAAKMVPKCLMVGHVIPMGEVKIANAAHCF